MSPIILLAAFYIIDLTAFSVVYVDVCLFVSNNLETFASSLDIYDDKRLEDRQLSGL